MNKQQWFDLPQVVATPVLILRCWVALLVLSVSWGGCAVATAQEERSEPKVAVTVTPAGVQRFSAGNWAALAVIATNQTDEDREEIVSVFVGEESSLQFSKRLWIPAKGKRSTWIPILLPEDLVVEGRTVDVSTIRLADSAQGEVYTENSLGMPISRRSVMLTPDEINTAVVFNTNTYHDDQWQTTDNVYELLYAGRDSAISGEMGLALTDLFADFIPPTHRSLAELDQLVLAGDHMLGDTGGIDAIRNWVRAGGRIWIQLDLVSGQMVEQLLGEDVPYSVVDRVELNELEYTESSLLPGGDLFRNEVWTSEIPVDMVRVICDAEEVAYQADGWPAAFWHPFGQGEILFTTLGSRAWLTPDKRPNTAYLRMANRFFESRNQPKPFQAAIAPILDDHIGYRIPDRQIAAVILCAQVLIVLLAGLWWVKTRRLEHIAWLIPLTTVSATLLFLYVGGRQTQSVPSTVATGQLVQVHNSTGELNVRSMHAVYSQDAGDLEAVADNRVLAMPIKDASRPNLLRLQADDSGATRWKGASQPPGVVKHIVSEANLSLEKPIAVTGSFDANGFRGTLVGLEGRKCEDALVYVANRPPMTASLAVLPDGETFEVTGNEVLADDRFSGDAILSDRQRLRQDFLRNLLVDAERPIFGSAPTLLLWSDPFDSGVSFADRFSKIGSALLSVPIHIVSPEPGKDFSIPPTFIKMEPFLATQGYSSVYNKYTGKWLENLTNATDAEFLFKLPAGLGDVTLQQANLELKINAPSRSVKINAMVDGKRQTIFERQNPIGLVNVPIRRAEALAMHPDGGLWLSIEITESEKAKELRGQENQRVATKESDNTTWQIDWVRLAAVGRIDATDDSSQGNP